MLKKFLWNIIIVLISSSCFSQTNSPKHVDFLKRIIQKGLCQSDTKTCLRQQIQYIRACEQLGNHYTNLYLQKKNKDNINGLKYYLLAADLTDGTDSDLGDNETTYTLRDKMAMKAGDLYFKGIGIKKDLNNALYYHYRGLTYHKTNEREDYYSRLYFHNTQPIFKTNIGSSYDSMKIFAVNLFYMLRDLPIKNLHSLLGNFTIKFDTSINCLIQANMQQKLGSTLNGQAAMHKFIQKLKNYLVNSGFNPNRITLNVEFENADCKYKLYKLPCVTIKVSRETFSEF